MAVLTKLGFEQADKGSLRINPFNSAGIWSNRYASRYAAGGFQAVMTGNGAAWIQKLAAGFPAETTKAIKRAGFYVRDKIREGMKNQMPGGEIWPPYSELSQESGFKPRQLSKKRRRGSRRRVIGRNRSMSRRFPGQKLYNAVRTVHDAKAMTSRVGWVTRTAENKAEYFQTGKTVAVTDKMRRFFFATGHPIATRNIRIPGRPVIAPVLRAEERNIRLFIENRVADYIHHGMGYIPPEAN